jgi:hypothetical protein
MGSLRGINIMRDHLLEIQKKYKKLENEYTDWLVENLPRKYVEEQDCSAEAVIFEALEGGMLTLNAEQKNWLTDFCKRWDTLGHNVRQIIK